MFGNAIARPLAGGDEVDPFAGVADLRAGRLRAVSPSVFALHHLTLSQGRALLPVDDENARRVCVLGAEVAAGFPQGAVGKRVRLGYAYFEVVGVLCLVEREEAGGRSNIEKAAPGVPFVSLFTADEIREEHLRMRKHEDDPLLSLKREVGGE